MKSLFVMSGIRSPRHDFWDGRSNGMDGMGGTRRVSLSGPALGQDIWGSIFGALPTAIDKGTDVYLKEQDQKIAQEKADQAKAAAAQAQATAQAALAQNTILGIDKGTFIIGAVGVGLVAIIATIAIAK